MTAGGPGTILVTGGAKRIGAAIVRGLARAGHRIVIHYGASGAAAHALAADIVASGGQALALAGDLAAPETPARLMAAARDAFGAPVSGLVNSASQFDYDSPASFDAAMLARLSAVNLAAPLALAREMAAQDDLSSGAIVNLLDQKLANPNPDFFSYTATKYALAGATVMMAQAFAPRISVNAVAPGISLPSFDQSEDEFVAVASGNLMRRPIDVAEIARAVCFLMTARGVTGQTIHVDNGQRFVPSARDVMFATRA